MKLSIVIPVYNVHDYLKQCVSSALKIKAETELILVDDGSTDGSGELCDRLAVEDERIVVIHQPNGGLSAARNTGIHSSRGDYVMFLDADDFINPQETQHMLEALYQGPEVLMGLYREYYADGGEHVPERCEAFLKVEGLLPMESFLKLVPADGRSCYMVACRFIVRRELLLSAGLDFFPEIYHEDEEWTSRLFCSADNIFLSHSFFYEYRQNRSGAITSEVKPKHIWDCLFILERDMSLYTRHQDCSAREEYLRSRMGQLCVNVMLNLRVLDKDGRQLAQDKLRSCIETGVPRLSGLIGSSVRLSISLLGIKPTCALLQTAQRIKKRK